MSKKKEQKTKTWLRVVTLILGLGFTVSTAAIGLSGLFNKNTANSKVSESTEGGENAEEQIQMQISGYEKVLEREPKNATALQGLAQIYLQTGKMELAIPVIEKLVAYYPNQPEYAGILQLIKQQQAQQPATTPQTK